MSPGVARMLLLALVALAVVSLASGCEEETDALACSVDTDCERFGLSATCQSGRCRSEAITCAQDGDLDPAKGTGLEELPTYAALLEEWLGFGSDVAEGFCQLREDCGAEDGATCFAGIPAQLALTCCQQTVDFYLAQRAALAACPVTIACEALEWEAFCPPLSDVAFENLCD